MKLRERLRRWWKPADYEDEHPLSQQERQDQQAPTTGDELGKLGGEFVGDPTIDPDDESQRE